MGQLCPVFTVGLRVEDNWSKLFDQHSRENPNGRCSIRSSGQNVGPTSPLEMIGQTSTHVVRVHCHRVRSIRCNAVYSS